MWKLRGRAAGGDEIAAVDRRVPDIGTCMGRLDHLAATDVEALVVEVRPEEHEVTGLQLRQRHVGRRVVLRLGVVRQRDAARPPGPHREPGASAPDMTGRAPIVLLSALY